MRIAVVCFQFPVSSETFVYAQVIGLLKLGHEVQVFCDAPQSNALAPSEVIRAGLPARTNYFTWPPARLWKRLPKIFAEILYLCVRRARALKLVRRHLGMAFRESQARRFFDAAAFWRHEKFDVVLCHFGQVGSRIGELFSAGLIEGKLAVVFHGADVSVVISQHGPAVYQDLFKTGDLFLPVSSYWARALARYGCPQERLLVHHMGVESDALRYVERTLAQDAGATVRFLSICRFVEKKGLQFAIRALREALPKLRHPVEYLIVGDGPLMQSIRELIAECDLGHSVRLLGWKDHAEVGRLLTSCHVFVAPSVTAGNGDEEGIPVAIMEAMAVGLPVLATLHSGIPELVEDGVSGLLAAERDISGLADRMVELVNHPQKWAEMGRAGRGMIEKQFDQPKLHRQLENVLHRTIEGQRA